MRKEILDVLRNLDDALKDESPKEKLKVGTTLVVASFLEASTDPKEIEEMVRIFSLEIKNAALGILAHV